MVDRQLFDAHNPLCFELHTCSVRPCTRVWRIPKSWSSLGVSPKELAAAFQTQAPKLLRQVQQCQCSADVGEALQTFSEAAENSVAQALALQHAVDPVRQPLAHLPRAYRGRCRPRKLVHKEVCAVSRPDRMGGFTPDVEVTSVLARMKVRQVRRILTFQRGLDKWHRAGSPAEPSGVAQLRAEWRAILRAKGYPPNFPAWILEVAHFTHFPVEFPTADWLSDLLAYVRFDCECLARQEARRRKSDFLHQVCVDTEVGGCRQGFRAMRAAPNPPFTEVPCTVQVEVERLPNTIQSDGVAVYQMQGSGVFLPGQTASLEGISCVVQSAKDSEVALHGECLPATGLLVQSYTACTPTELHAAFDAFWGPLWQRDKGDSCQSLSSWPKLQTILAESCFSCPEMQLNCSPAQWRAAIKRMPARKATGICGWSPSDLKILPDVALELLSAIFNKAVLHGLPAHLLQARVCVLAKAFSPSHIKQSRPITIFSTLYRIWASVVTREVLQAWSLTFPPSVMGSMPGKACRDVSYRQQHWIELSLLAGTARYGFSLDIVKCFNQLGWPAIETVMVRLGVPEAIVVFWLNCLSKLERHSCFLGNLSKGTVCFNGAPEGDPLSVAALAGICCFAEEACRTQGVSFDTYVDNWSWSGQIAGALEKAIPKALRFLDALALPIDWSKSYTWATTAAGRAWWKKAHNRVFPANAQVQQVSEVRDLGVAFKFDGCAHAMSRGARITDGVERLDRLRNQPRSPSLKASMIQRGVWPACLYGAEGHAFTLAELQLLRGRAARTIVGQHTVLSPFLALAAISTSCQDPQLYCLDQQLQVLRRTCQLDSELGLSILEIACQTPAKRGYQGPATALRLALDRLGLTISSVGVLKGRDNTWVDVTACHRAEIKGLLQRSWSLYVQEQVSHRNGLGSAPEVHTGLTGKLLQKFSSNDQIILARHITGAFSSAAAKNKWDPEISSQCPLCGGLQTKHHKFLQCPALRPVRDGCVELLREVEEDWPHWIHAPYVAMPANLEVNRLVFATRALLMPSAVELDMDKIGTRPFLRMFTDGSCRHPGVPDASYAGFAVILDTSPCDASIPGILHQWRSTGCPPNEFRVLCQGSVPGLQSINRAEVCAVIQAIRLAVILRAPACEIWTDSAFAISEFERARTSLAGTWPDLCSLLRRLPLETVNLRKIASHQDLSKLWGMEQWFAAGNSAADVAAKSAVGRELQCVQDIAATAADCIHRQTKLLPAFWKYLLQLSAEEMRLLRALDVPDAPAARPLAGSKPEAWLALNRGPFQAWTVPDFQREWLLACSWPPWFTVPVWSWVRNLQWTILPPRGRAPPGVAYVELLTDFVYKFRLLPPAGLLANRDPLNDETSSLVAPMTLRQLNHSLVEAVRQLERLSGVAQAAQQSLFPERTRL